MQAEPLYAWLKRLGVYGLESRPTASGWVNAHCPFAPWKHKGGRDNHPSFGVHTDDHGKTWFKCYSCREAGSLSQLAYRLGFFRNDTKFYEYGRQIENDELSDAITTIPEWDDAQRTRQTTDKEDRDRILRSSREYTDFPFAWSVPAARDYLTYRGITFRTCVSLNLRYDPAPGRILFAVKDSSRRLRGYSGRLVEYGDTRSRTPIRDYYGLQKRRLFLGEHRLHGLHRTASAPDTGRFRRPTFALIVEGLFDYAIAVQHIEYLGWPIAPLALLGASLTPEKYGKLIRWGLPIIWMTDNDAAGSTALHGELRDDGTRKMGALAHMSPHVPQFVVDYPEGFKDPGSLAKHRDLFADMLRKKVAYWNEQLDRNSVPF